MMIILQATTTFFKAFLIDRTSLDRSSPIPRPIYTPQDGRVIIRGDLQGGLYRRKLLHNHAVRTRRFVYDRVRYVSPKSPLRSCENEMRRYSLHPISPCDLDPLHGW